MLWGNVYHIYSLTYASFYYLHAVKAVDWDQGFQSSDWSKVNIFQDQVTKTWYNLSPKCMPVKAKAGDHNPRH